MIETNWGNGMNSTVGSSPSKSFASTPVAVAQVSLGRQWKQFGRVLFEPWTLILIFSAAVLFYLSQKPLAEAANVLAQTMLALVSAVLGGRVTNQVSELTGQSVLVARGKVAVRGLKLMLLQTAAFERRVKSFIGRRDHIEENPDITVRNYEEILEFCRRAKEEVGSAMETWNDVVPGADLGSWIGLITELTEERDLAKQQLDAANEQLQNAGETLAGHEESAGQLADLQQNVESLKAIVSARESELNELKGHLKSRAADATSFDLREIYELAKRRRDKAEGSASILHGTVPITPPWIKAVDRDDKKP